MDIKVILIEAIIWSVLWMITVSISINRYKPANIQTSTLQGSSVANMLLT